MRTSASNLSNDSRPAARSNDKRSPALIDAKPGVGFRDGVPLVSKTGTGIQYSTGTVQYSTSTGTVP